MASGGAGFESYMRGSWWEVQIREQRSGMYLVSYKASKEEDWAWLPMTELRLSSRSADDWDCSFLTKGMDLSILARHPQCGLLGLDKEAFYDARLVSVRRSNHAPGSCSCTFSVKFFSVKVDTYTDGSIDERTLLTELPETEVCISNMRILQQPSAKIPLDEIFEAHMDQSWIPLGRGCVDAFFLKETDLANRKKPRKSHEILSAVTSAGRNGEKWSNCNSAVHCEKKDVLGTLEERETARHSSGTIPDDADNNQVPEHSSQPDHDSPPSIKTRHCLSSTQDEARDKTDDFEKEPQPMSKPERDRPREISNVVNKEPAEPMKRKRGRPRKIVNGIDPVRKQKTKQGISPVRKQEVRQRKTLERFSQTTAGTSKPRAVVYYGEEQSALSSPDSAFEKPGGKYTAAYNPETICASRKRGRPKLVRKVLSSPDSDS